MELEKKNQHHSDDSLFQIKNEILAKFIQIVRDQDTVYKKTTMKVKGLTSKKKKKCVKITRQNQ